jgi:hypothetical protein
MKSKPGSEPQTVEVKQLTSKNDRKRMSDALSRWKRIHAPRLSIDVLLTRPFDTLGMALSIGEELRTIPPSIATKIQRVLWQFQEDHQESIAVINEICARAMNDRKRGLLKPQRAAARQR